jgi:hypothetical protein
VIPPALLFLLSIALAIRDRLYFQMNFRKTAKFQRKLQTLMQESNQSSRNENTVSENKNLIFKASSKLEPTEELVNRKTGKKYIQNLAEKKK